MSRTLKAKKNSSKNNSLNSDSPILSFNFPGDECLVRIIANNNYTESGDFSNFGYDSLSIIDNNDNNLLTLFPIDNLVKQTTFTGFQITNVSNGNLLPNKLLSGFGRNSTQNQINPVFPLKLRINNLRNDVTVTVIDIVKKITTLKEVVTTSGYILMGMTKNIRKNISNKGTVLAEIDVHDVELIDKHFGEHKGMVVE